MKKLLLIITGFTLSYSVLAQESIQVDSEPVVGTYWGTSQQLGGFTEPPGTVHTIVKLPYKAKNPDEWGGNPKVNKNALPNGIDPALQTIYSEPASLTKALIANWDGIAGEPISPADPTMDVGPNHVVQMINGGAGAYVAIYDKTGGVLQAKTLFRSFAGTGMTGGGDAIVMYDERADRWFLSEFQSGGNNLILAVSQTANPLGAYHIYTYLSTGGFPDYPKYAIWENEYVMTANVNTPDIYAFNRADLLVGTATAAQKFNQTNFGTIGFQASTPVTMNGTTLPPSGQNALLMRMRDDAWAGAATDALEMWELDIDWANSANSALTLVQEIGTTPHDSELCGYTSFQCFDQPNGQPLDPLREMLMNRIHYRNFGTHESIVCAHVTDVDGSDRGGIRWYELRRTGGTAGAWAIYQESTYSPTSDSDHRWMPSIGISATGNIGLAYSVTGGSTFPSLRYTGRKECDPLNQMTEPETNIVVGTGSQTNERWGDYFQMGTDPSDGETFYFNGVYMNGSNWQTRIAAFAIDQCIFTPEVSFGGSTFDVNEVDGTTPNACLPYSILTIPISIALDPSQSADVTVNVTGGTATNNVDYAIQNNTFSLDGTTLTGDVIIWVYNDVIVEGTETITLDYSLNANGGDAVAGPLNQIVTITINDDDVDVANMTNSTVLFQDNFEDATLAPFTTVNTAGATAFQVGNLAAASNATFTINTSNTGQFAWVNDDDCNCDQNDVKLTLPSVDLTNYVGANLTFSSYFEGNTWETNTETAEVYVSISGGADVLLGAIAPSGVDGTWTPQNFDLTAYAGSNDVVLSLKYSDGTGWLYGLAVDDFTVNGETGIGVQTAVNTGAGYTADLGPNATVHFVDQASNKVMMTLENTTAFDYGCVTVEVDRDGSTPTATEFNSSNVADYLHSKTYTVVPTNNNPTGAYNMTVYYEEAEVLAWETATGNSRNNAEIVKVAGANKISDVTPATVGSFTIANSSATVGAFNGNVTFTASLSGFSGFGVGIYTPVVLTAPTASFTADATTVCESENIMFTDTSIDAPTSWSWTFGDGGVSMDQNPVYTYATAGSWTVTLTVTNAIGSDIATMTSMITVNAPSVSSQTVNLCPGQSVTVGTSTYNSAGVNTDLLVNAVGCDSTVTTTVTMLSPTTSALTYDLCPGASVTVGTSTYNSAGTYADVILNAAGCDSTITTTITMLATSTNNQTLEICTGGSVTVGTSTYNSVGSYIDILTNIAGCDSTVISTVNVLSPIINNQTVQICIGGSVSVGTSTYTSAGTYTDLLTSVAGCDSTVNTTVTAVTSIITNQSVTLCPGETITVGSSTYNSAGSYTDVLTALGGCDSTVNTVVSAAVPTSSSQSVDICAGESVVVGISTYTIAGTYTDVIPNTAGCDSTITTTVNVLATLTSSQDVSFCPGGSVIVGSSTYTTAGTFTDNFTSSNECDSIVTTNVILTLPTSSTQNIDICPGGSVTVGTNTYNSAGTYTDVLTNAGGCDSTITTTVTMSVESVSSLTYDLCPGSSVTVGTSTYNSAGVFTDVIANAAGCDSTITTTVTMLTTSTFTQTLDVCDGASITVGSNTYTTTGVYTDVFSNSLGCDSTVTTNLTVNALPTVSSTPTDIGLICSYSDPVTLVGSPAGGAFSGTGITGSTFNPATAGIGTHTISYSYTDGNGCIGTINVSAQVDGCLGISEELLEGVNLYPNPNDGTFQVTGLAIGSEYKVYDDKGSVIISATVGSEPKNVILPNVSTGVYYLRSVKNGKEGNIKFLIVK